MSGGPWARARGQRAGTRASAEPRPGHLLGLAHGNGNRSPGTAGLPFTAPRPGSAASPSPARLLHNL